MTDEIWGTAREKVTDTFFREPIPNCRVVRYAGVSSGIANPILFELADFENVEVFKKADPEPDKLKELAVERITTPNGKEYAIPGEHYVLKKDFSNDVYLVEKKRFKRIYTVLVSEDCARLCAEDSKKYEKEVIKFTATSKRGASKEITFTSRKPVKRDE